MARFELKLPKLGESVAEGTIGKWLKQPGDRVAKDDLLVEVQTDKVNTEVPSPIDGTLAEVAVAEGETVAVGTVIAVFETGAAEAAKTEEAPAPAKTADREPSQAKASASTSSPTPSPSPSAPEAPRAQVSSSASPASAPASSAAAPTPARASRPAPSAAAAEVRATPAVRKLASESGVDIGRLEGTGLNGRVTRDDVERAIAGGGAGDGAPADEVAPLTQMRRAIANAMVLSKTTIPHAASMVEVDWTNVAKLREAHKAAFKDREGFDLTFLPFAMMAVCEALRVVPLVNAHWSDQGIVKPRAIHLGVAISLGDEGLVVPVLKDADRLSITGLARGVHDLATRARGRKLTLPDFEGGTFTVNNGGTLGTYLSYPIINPGQGAIMTTEAIGKRVVVLEGDVMAIRSMGNMVLSFDHRVMDGATAARFLREVKTWIQNVDDRVSIA